MYCIVFKYFDIELSGFLPNQKAQRISYSVICKAAERIIIELMKTDSNFTPPTPIAHTMNLIKDFMGFGTKMGEGWLLPAEMLELNDEGVHNIVCTQPSAACRTTYAARA